MVRLVQFGFVPKVAPSLHTLVCGKIEIVWNFTSVMLTSYSLDTFSIVASVFFDGKGKALLFMNESWFSFFLLNVFLTVGFSACKRKSFGLVMFSAWVFRSISSVLSFSKAVREPTQWIGFILSNGWSFWNWLCSSFYGFFYFWSPWFIEKVILFIYFSFFPAICFYLRDEFIFMKIQLNSCFDIFLFVDK